MSLTVEDSALKTNITAPPFIEIPVQSQGSERSCMGMSVRDIDLASFPMIFTRFFNCSNGVLFLPFI